MFNMNRSVFWKRGLPVLLAGLMAFWISSCSEPGPAEPQAEPPAGGIGKELNTDPSNAEGKNENSEDSSADGKEPDLKPISEEDSIGGRAEEADPHQPQDGFQGVPIGTDPAQSGQSGTESGTRPGENSSPPLIAYHGPVEHIFFHPLIVYPELAFDGDAMAKGYDDWFVTIKEFNAILESLYRNQYMLISLESLFERGEEDGKRYIKRKQLMMPEGKKPLVLSIDDLNYYEYMRENGNAHKLVLDEEGNVSVYTVDPNGNASVSASIEIVPIVDEFVRKHPDFSLNGAKGVIALTGYEGVLGYRTNERESPDYEREKEAAEAVVKKLKQTGWTFASHGWGHLDARKVSLERLVQDTKRWKEEVEPIIGYTPVYIYPYGSRPDTGSDKFHSLLEAGFDILCSVGPTPYLKLSDGAAMMDRRHIDGMALRTQGERLSVLFDASVVLDPVRPPATGG